MAIMTYDQWFKANGNKGNWGGYQQYVMRQGGGKITRQGPDGGAEARGWSGEGAPDQTGMRAWARQHGFSEDFDRFDERTLSAWEQHKDSRCPPHAPYAAINGTGCVEKPIDTNYNAQNASYLGVQPGEKGYWYGPDGEKRPMGGARGGGATEAAGGGAAEDTGKIVDDSFLQNQLVDLYSKMGGYFGEQGGGAGVRLGEGGVWWQDPGTGGTAETPAATPPPPGAPGGAAPPQGGVQTHTSGFQTQGRGGFTNLTQALANTPLFSGGGFTGGQQARQQTQPLSLAPTPSQSAGAFTKQAQMLENRPATINTQPVQRKMEQLFDNRRSGRLAF